MALKCYLPHCEEALVLPSLALWIVISPSGMWNIFTEKVNTEQAVVNLSIVVSSRQFNNLIWILYLRIYCSIWKTFKSCLIFCRSWFWQCWLLLCWCSVAAVLCVGKVFAQIRWIIIFLHNFDFWPHDMGHFCLDFQVDVWRRRKVKWSSLWSTGGSPRHTKASRENRHLNQLNIFLLLLYVWKWTLL